jgi:hypothetical protein
MATHIGSLIVATDGVGNGNLALPALGFLFGGSVQKRWPQKSGISVWFKSTRRLLSR